MNHSNPRLPEVIGDDLEDIEKALTRNLTPYYELVHKIARHILFSGGKRLRPLLMILSARINGYRGNEGTTLSTVFEYLHAATLLHDDLVDDATVRRGKKVAHLMWDNATAVLVGDFLLARSLSIAAATGRPAVVKIIARITEDMSQGEIHQLDRKGHLDLSEAEYMELIRRKTAELLKGACRVGAIIADADKEKET
ncbi:MAG: polyprenyl synthetase family protein, partial [Desulfobacterales bacterium]|nr:polyprenyl synthetase family protein [Desulfobacterales bacterium]